MRILQMIDSLDIGGAEKMAVNYANALSKEIEFSAIVSTRKEGALKSQINDSVHYFYLHRKSVLDVFSIARLRKYCVVHGIEIVQPHSSSFFTAFLLKLVLPKIKIVWHDHNGLSEFISPQRTFVTKIASSFFSGIIVVNDYLKKWAQNKLWCQNIIYLPNFTTLNRDELGITVLKGNPGKQILCLANLRYQKNHFFLLEVSEMLKASHPDWTFHLVGKDFNDDYSTKLKQSINSKRLEEHVFIYGSKQDTFSIINQAEIAIITSLSEGLPVALLEFGLCNKAVVSTDVGEIPLIVKKGNNGFLVSKEDVQTFYTNLVQLIENPDLRQNLGKALNQTINEHHSEQAVLKKYLTWINSL